MANAIVSGIILAFGLTRFIADLPMVGPASPGVFVLVVFVCSWAIAVFLALPLVRSARSQIRERLAGQGLGNGEQSPKKFGRLLAQLPGQFRAERSLAAMLQIMKPLDADAARREAKDILAANSEWAVRHRALRRKFYSDGARGVLPIVLFILVAFAAVAALPAHPFSGALAFGIALALMHSYGIGWLTSTEWERVMKLQLAYIDAFQRVIPQRR